MYDAKYQNYDHALHTVTTIMKERAMMILMTIESHSLAWMDPPCFMEDSSGRVEETL